MNEFKIIKETINELEYQETNGLLTDRGIAYLKELKQALQLQQTGVIKSFYCNSDATLEKRCDKQCSWCRSYEMIME